MRRHIVELKIQFARLGGTRGTVCRYQLAYHPAAIDWSHPHQNDVAGQDSRTPSPSRPTTGVDPAFFHLHTPGSDRLECGT